MTLLSISNTKIKIALSLVLLAVMLLSPMFLSEFRLGLLGKFLAFAILAMGLDLIWGYTGILSLGHGVYFGLGAYGMAMHLKLAASQGGLPDFMSWSGVETLPWFWVPFQSAGAAVALALIVPMAVAFVLGYLTFRNRIRGAFFSILSQALVIITVTLFVGQQGWIGGTNGLTGFDTFLGLKLGESSTKLALYYVTVVVLGLTLLLCLWLAGSRLGKILVAVRDAENRVRFIGYNPVAYKVFIYCVSAGLAGLAGMLFILQEGIISPAQMGIVPSIEMVLWVAVGGRATIYGAVIGAIAANAAKTTFSEAYPEWWPIIMGAMFIVVTLFLPKGIVGTLKDLFEKWGRSRQALAPTAAVPAPGPLGYTELEKPQ
ncbi:MULTISPECIES: urea ABC transporter permease subunit UrtC [Paenibacillus]|uniref:Urea ABC transporter permease n=1 Tax=Paenibacillus naphthalenovorans TaxID=162209 RepID=A0A0U2MTP1_9BACL|nr:MULTISPECIES: urea ABC transporter permease subunit UrtC [Paenibacillus]ALS20655.1 urea ABC transporter permease [Paenibacillus naphthalenovorans]NTZ17923.1 urea ABC transporter permease subunit UrtC [Paenibacillus sp. JMULE4]GCL70686.1 urea ABC transporter permease subunit UrtC [Paenibacillus naphthalenovorans]SDI26082.1 urea transport system permease protein [Paenibacillus naphthalenovorans]